MIYSVGLIGLTILFFTLLMTVSPILYRRRIQVKYSLKNMFPFEFTYKSLPNENLYTFIFLALFVLSSVGFFATFDLTYSNGYLIFSMISGIICSVMIFMLFIVPFTNLRLHLITAVIFFVLNFANSGSILIASLKSNQEYSEPIKIICIVIAIILVAIEFCSILNPRLNLKFRAIEKTNENGEVVYERPKWVVFAFTEWLNIFLFIINMINITILTFSQI